MFYPNFSVLTCVSFVIFVTVFSDSRTKDTDMEIDVNEQEFLRDHLHLLNTHELNEEAKDSSMKAHELDEKHKLFDVSENTEEHLDFERRRIIASKYLETLENVKQDWIDPYDMGGFSLLEKHSKGGASKTTAPETTSAPLTITEKDDSLSLNIKKEELCTSTSASVLETLSTPKEQQCALDNLYITRWLKKLLLRIEKESSPEYSAISFQLDSDTLDKLKKMSSSKTFEVPMLDEMLSNMVAQAEIKRKESYYETAYTYQTDILWGIIYASAVLVFIYTLRRSFLHRPKLTMLCCGIVINIGWHWMHLYQKIKAHKHAELSSMQIPSQCKKHDLGLFEHMAEYFKSFFTSSECSKYYEALLVDPFWEVSFSVAATEAVTATLFQPLFASSRAVNYFLKQLFDGLPIYLTAFVILFIFFVTLMKFGYAIRLPLFMGRIEPCHPVAGSRVEELERTLQPPKLSDIVRDAVTGPKNTNVKQILKEYSSIKASFTEASKESHSQSIEYTSNKDGTGKCVYKQDSQTTTFRRTVDSEDFPVGIRDKKISEEGLAVRSGFFEVLTEDEIPEPIQHTFSVGTEVDFKSSDDSTVSVISTKKPTIPASMEEIAKQDCDVYVSSTQAEGVLASNSVQSLSDNGGMCLDRNDELEVSNLPSCMTDSFEIIPREDDVSASMLSNRSAGPNCDTSQDILSEMHRGCQFCNSTGSIL